MNVDPLSTSYFGSVSTILEEELTRENFSSFEATAVKVYITIAIDSKNSCLNYFFGQWEFKRARTFNHISIEDYTKEINEAIKKAGEKVNFKNKEFLVQINIFAQNQGEKIYWLNQYHFRKGNHISASTICERNKLESELAKENFDTRDLFDQKGKLKKS